MYNIQYTHVHMYNIQYTHIYMYNMYTYICVQHKNIQLYRDYSKFNPDNLEGLLSREGSRAILSPGYMGVNIVTQHDYFHGLNENFPHDIMYVNFMPTSFWACKNDSSISDFFFWGGKSCNFSPLLVAKPYTMRIQGAMETAIARAPVQICDVNPEQPADFFFFFFFFYRDKSFF